MSNFGVQRDKWVCPTDRELALRSRLQTGWSVKTYAMNTFTKPSTLSEAEKAIIKSVIDRAEHIDKLEQERVGRLVERVENMKKNAIGNGETQCVLCADQFSRLRSMPMFCIDCKKAVCAKCGVEQFLTAKETNWLCKICAETREMWKKSGAWFYKSLPKYVMPVKKKSAISVLAPRTYESCFARELNRSSPLAQGRLMDERESTDSSDDDVKIPRATVKLTERLCSDSDSGGASSSRDALTIASFGFGTGSSINSICDPVYQKD